MARGDSPARSRSRIGVTSGADLPGWSGRLFLWPGRALYVGPGSDTAVHAHHAVQLCIALDGPLALRERPAARWREFYLALIAPDRPHQIDGRGHELALLYLDPECMESRALLEALHNGFSVASTGHWTPHVPRLRECGGPPCSAGQACTVIDGLLTSLCPHPDVNHRVHEEHEERDARVATVIERVRGAPATRLSAAQAGATVGLSTHRFQHLFRDETGIPFRRYLLWLRLIAAVEDVAAGESLTDAAHGAGFSDSAHLSRTFRRMFGLTPSTLAKRSTFVQATVARKS